MAVKAVSVAEHESWPFASARALHQPLRRFIHSANVLTIHDFAWDTKGGGSLGQIASSRLGVMGIFVVHVVFTDVNDRELPQRGHIHDLVEDTLTQRAIAKEADGHLVAAAHLDRHSSPGGDTRTSAYNGIRAQVAGILVGN